MKRNRISEIHFYEWRVSLWLISETRQRLDAAGRGIYRELLDHCYGQGKMPCDAEWMCARCACTADQFEKAWRVISRHFPMIEGTDYRYNVHADIVRQEYFNYVEKQRENRKCRDEKRNVISNIDYDGSTKNKSGRKQNQPNGNGNGNGNGNVKEQTPLSAVADGKEKRPQKIWYDESFSSWYAGFWNHTGKQPARKAYEKAINKLVDSGKKYNEAKLFLVSQESDYRRNFEHDKSWEWRIGLHPATWLNKELWTDEVQHPAPTQLPIKSIYAKDKPMTKEEMQEYA